MKRTGIALLAALALAAFIGGQGALAGNNNGPTVSVETVDGVFQPDEFAITIEADNPFFHGTTYEEVKWKLTFKHEELTPDCDPADILDVVEVNVVQGQPGDYYTADEVNESFEVDDGELVGQLTDDGGVTLSRGDAVKIELHVQMTPKAPTSIDGKEWEVEVDLVHLPRTESLDSDTFEFTLAKVVNLDTDTLFHSIQKAIDCDSTTAGDTIKVAPGRYEEDVRVDKERLTLLGARAGVDARDPTGDESILQLDNAVVVKVEAAGVTLDGFTIEADYEAATGNAVEVTNKASGLLFENNILDVSGDYETKAMEVQDVPLAGALRIRRSVFRGGEEVIGIDLRYPRGTENVYIEESDFDTLEVGILVRGTRVPVFIDGNTFANIQQDGSWDTDGVAIKVFDPQDSAPDIVVTNNEFHASTDDAIFFSAEYPDAEWHGTQATVQNNRFETGGWGIWIHEDGENLEVDATNNWWGCDTGPSGGEEDPVTGVLAVGEGDAVSENVRFDPWWGRVYTITTVAPDEGTIRPSSPSVERGEDQTFTIEPDQGYAIAKVTVEDLLYDDVDDKEYTPDELDEENGKWLLVFEEVGSDYRVSVEFTDLELELTVDSTDGGEVDKPGEGSFTYDYGEEVELEAVADENYRFVEWTGDIDKLADPEAAETTIEMFGDYSITAEFSTIEVELTTSSTDGGEVTVPGEGSFTYDHGEDVDVKAVAESGYEFVEWTGEIDKLADPEAAETTIEMLGDYTITAEFIHTGLESVSTVFEPGWNMVSIPLKPEDGKADPETVFSDVKDAQGDLIIWWYDPAPEKQEYVVPDTIEPGRGYWVLFDDTTEVTVEGFLVDPDEYAVYLPYEGWQQISVPTADVPVDEVPVSDILWFMGDEGPVETGAAVPDWLALWENDVVGWDYNIADNDYDPIELEDDLNSWTGYWIYTYEDGISMLPLADPTDPPPPPPPLSTDTAITSADLAPTHLTPPPPPGMETGASMLEVTAYPNPLERDGEIVFQATGLPVQELQVAVYDTSGQLLFYGQASGNQLSWDTLNQRGQPVANGVYLYTVQAKVAGQWLSVSAERLLILR